MRFWILIFVVLAGLAGMLTPFIIDAHHWWPRRQRKK
jgi:hypothetical protein